MSAYLDNHYAGASDRERHCFETLLDMPDPDLYALILGRRPADDETMEAFLHILRKSRP